MGVRSQGMAVAMRAAPGSQPQVPMLHERRRRSPGRFAAEAPVAVEPPPAGAVRRGPSRVPSRDVRDVGEGPGIRAGEPARGEDGAFAVTAASQAAAQPAPAPAVTIEEGIVGSLMRIVPGEAIALWSGILALVTVLGVETGEPVWFLRASAAAVIALTVLAVWGNALQRLRSVEPRAGAGDVFRDGWSYYDVIAVPAVTTAAFVLLPPAAIIPVEPLVPLGAAFLVVASATILERFRPSSV